MHRVHSSLPYRFLHEVSDLNTSYSSHNVTVVVRSMMSQRWEPEIWSICTWFVPVSLLALSTLVYWTVIIWKLRMSISMTSIRGRGTDFYRYSNTMQCHATIVTLLSFIRRKGERHWWQRKSKTSGKVLSSASSCPSGDCYKLNTKERREALATTEIED